MRPTLTFLFTAAVGVALCVLAPGPSASRQDDVKDQGKKGEKDKLSAAQADVMKHVDDLRKALVAVNQDVWAYAELGLEEHRSSARLVKMLESAGFTVEKGVADMPTAFVASWGKGGPVIGILAEYDALPELSQQVTGERKAVADRGTGHGCGHCALGTAALGAALALKAVMEKHNIPGTIRLYGTPAEETVIGKVYMVLAGLFGGLDVCLHWHPGVRNRIDYGSSKALVSARFTFNGLPSHASGSPDRGRSALDGVELMNVGANYMREHVKQTNRLHYVITKGGEAPNVVPATAQVWYYVRGDAHEDAVRQFDWLKDIADGAAKMSRTKVAHTIDTDCHEIIPNLPLSKVIEKNFRRVGPPVFDETDRKLARQLQEPLKTDFGLKEDKALLDTIEPLPKQPYAPMGGSTDVGDVSWHVPTGGFTAVCFAAGSPGHSWQNVAASGSPIAHKGLIVAAKVLALSALELFQDEGARREAKADFDARMKGRRYTTIIPKGQKAPRSIR
jgi:aminobenzoyl-glutamate utilization protein B